MLERGPHDLNEAVESLREGIKLGVDPWDAPIDFILERLERHAIDSLRSECLDGKLTSILVPDLKAALDKDEDHLSKSSANERPDTSSILNKLHHMDSAGTLTPSAENSMQVLIGVKRVRDAVTDQDAPEAALQACILFAASLRSEISEMSEEALQGLHLHNIRKKGGKESAISRLESVKDQHEQVIRRGRILLAEGNNPREISELVADSSKYKKDWIRIILQRADVLPRKTRKK